MMKRYKSKLPILILVAYAILLITGCTLPQEPYFHYYWERIEDPHGVFTPTTEWGDIFLKDITALPSVGQSGEPGFVVIGHEWMAEPGPSDKAKAAAWISNDGQIWSRVHYDGFEAGQRSTYMTAATRFRDKLVVVGILWDYDKPPEAPTDARVWISNNGTDWNWFSFGHTINTQQRPPWLEHDTYHKIIEPTFGPTDVAASETCVVAVGSSFGSATIWRSTDGETWSEVYVAEPYYEDRSHIVSVVRIENSFLAFGGYERGGPAMWRSTDGIEWEIERSFPNGKFLYSAALQDDGRGWILGKGIDGTYLAWQRNSAGVLTDPIEIGPRLAYGGNYTIRWALGNIGDPLLIISHKPDGGIQVRRILNERFLFDSLSPAEEEIRLYGRRVESLHFQPETPIRIMVGNARKVHIDPLLEGPAHGAIWVWRPARLEIATADE